MSKDTAESDTGEFSSSSHNLKHLNIFFSAIINGAVNTITLVGALYRDVQLVGSVPPCRSSEQCRFVLLKIRFCYSTYNFESSNPEQESARPFWKNRYQHLFFFLAYCVNIRSLSSLIYEDFATNPKDVPSLIQTVLVCIIIAGPLIFIQNFIGQFTQKGCIAIGAMLPATYGFGFCMLVVGVLECVQTLYFAGGGLIYVMTSMLNFPYPAWMYCQDEFYERFPECFSREDIDLCQPCDVTSTPCFEPNSKLLSALIFRHMVAFEKDLRISEVVNVGLPQIKSVTHAFITILFVYFISCRRLKNLDWSLRLSLIICFLGTTVSLVVIFSHAGALRGFQRLFQFQSSIESMTNMESWIAAFRRVTEGLKISSGGHVLLGSYMTMDTPSHFRVCFLIGYYLLIVCLFYVHFYLMDSLLRCRLNVEDYGLQSANDITFVMYPTELGLAATPQLWCTIHFTVYWVLSVVSMVMQVVIADETLADEFKISGYYKYTRCCICAIIFLLTLPLTTKGGTIVARVLSHELKIVNLFVITLIFVVLFLYNTQRLKDDIHFVLNVPPTWYIQTCWILTAFFTGTMFLYQVMQYKSDNRFYLVRLPLYFFVGLPILIGFVVKMIQYVRLQNITGMFRPSAFYGAPDLNTRMLRLLYNPRLEVRYRRRKEMCKHRCLLNNEMAARAIERELALLEQIAYDLENNEEYKGEYSDVVAQLQEHYQVMKPRFTTILEHLQPTKKIYS